MQLHLLAGGISEDEALTAVMTHLGALLVDLVVHHATKHRLVRAPRLGPAWVTPTLRVLVLTTVCTST